MTDVNTELAAAAFEPDRWASVMLTCDPEPHKWQSAVRTRLTGWVDVLRPRMHEVSRENASRAVSYTYAAMKTATKQFLKGHKGYSEKVVDRLLDFSPFQTNYAAFLQACAEATAAGQLSRVSTRPQPDDLPPTHSPAYEHVKRLNQLLVELRDHSANEAVTPVSFSVQTQPARRRGNLFWFVYDPGVPAAIADAMVGRLESETARMMLWCASEWSVDDRIELLKHRERSLRRYAGFIAGIPGAVMPSIPAELRLNVPTILRQHAQGRDLLEAQIPRLLELAK